MPKDVYFCVDIEASGLVPALYNLVSIGVVPVVHSGGEGGGWRPSAEEFYVELKPIAPGFDPQAMAVHGITREHLERHGTPPEEAMRRLDEFVGRHRKRGRAVFVGHNAVFDWSFIAYYFELYGIPNPFGYKGLDTKALAMGCLGIGWFETSKENLKALLPSLPPEDASRAHRADYDARYQAEILCALLDRPPLGRSAPDRGGGAG
jgi:DNA polymerase III epsilon subunit-like protein